jgi:hypothetical protein
MKEVNEMAEILELLSLGLRAVPLCILAWIPGIVFYFAVAVVMTIIERRKNPDVSPREGS